MILFHKGRMLTVSDSEGDMVLFSTTEELSVALGCLTDCLLKVYVKPQCEYIIGWCLSEMYVVVF